MQELAVASLQRGVPVAGESDKGARGGLSAAVTSAGQSSARTDKIAASFFTEKSQSISASGSPRRLEASLQQTRTEPNFSSLIISKV